MVEFNFDPKAPIIVVNPKIEGVNGIKKVSMALDTGATYILIPWDVAEALGYEPELSRERIDMTTASGVEKVPLITLNSVSIFGKTVHNVKAAIHDLPPKSYVDGLLGLSFLRNFRICLDFKEGIMEMD